MKENKEEKPVEFLISPDFKEFYLKRRGLSQKAFADLMGYSEEQVSAILNRKIEPSYAFLRRLCFVSRLELGEVVQTKFNKIYNRRIKCGR
ncbi:MAG TPA: helix-turn-helix transcriptional regulator [Candidatus Cloacimonas acidaminovorans]|mgnify:CR=1 FL=1|nr:helix-turn-helix transcriptional regulator [Candidatus Cloacimonas acidaminovorans]